MKLARQKDFFIASQDLKPHRVSHGGECAQNKRKIIRPLDRKKPVHTVFKSSLAKGQYNFLNVKHRLKVQEIIRASALKFGVTIHRFENMGNHLHLVLSFTKRGGVQNFLRTVSAVIARLVTGACKGKPFGKKFWDHLVFTRVVSGRRDFQRLMNYMQKNEIERDNGPLNRTVVELFEKAQQKARRRGVDVWVVLDEINQLTRSQ